MIDPLVYLVCLQVQGQYFVDLSLPFGLWWAALCCQDTTSFITEAFREQGGMVLNYIDDFGGIARDHHTATHLFHMLQSLLQRFWLKEEAHTASPPQPKS